MKCLIYGRSSLFIKCQSMKCLSMKCPIYEMSQRPRLRILVTENQAKNIFVVLPSSPIKICSKLVKLFMSYGWIYKQKTDKQRLQLL